MYKYYMYFELLLMERKWFAFQWLDLSPHLVNFEFNIDFANTLQYYVWDYCSVIETINNMYKYYLYFELLIMENKWFAFQRLEYHPIWWILSLI